MSDDSYSKHLNSRLELEIREYEKKKAQILADKKAKAEASEATPMEKRK